MRIRPAIAATSLSLVLLAACDDGSDEPDEQASEVDDEQPTDGALEDDPGEDDAQDDDAQDDEALRDVTPPEVELLDAGVEPRRPLRLELEEGTEVTGTLAFEEEVVAAAGAEDGPPQAAEIELRLEVTEVADGQATIAFVYEAVTVDGEPVDGPTPLEGVEGEVVLDERSRVVGTTASAQGLDQLPIALPEEEVGVGATWEIRTEDVFGLPATQVMTVQLTDVDEDGYDLELSAVTDGPDEPAPMPDAGGQGADGLVLEELQRDSEGDQRVSTTSPFPTTSTLTTTTVLVVGLADGAPDGEGEEQQRQQLREEVTFERD